MEQNPAIKFNIIADPTKRVAGLILLGTHWEL